MRRRRVTAVSLAGMALGLVSVALASPTWRVAHASAPPPPLATSTPAPLPFPARAEPVFLPALDWRADEPACESEVSVQSVGDEPSKVLLLVWDATADCATCPGPSRSVCSGLLAPGTSWAFDRAALGARAHSAVAFSFNTRSLDELGLPGDATPAADRLCALLTNGAPGSCEAYRQFRRAYDEGADFAGVPLRFAYGVPVAIAAHRACRGDTDKLRQADAAYTGLTGSGGFEELLPYTSYSVNPAYAGSDGLRTVLFIQNRGLNCASVEVLFRPSDTCQRVRPCGRAFTVTAGSSAELRLTGCGDPSRPGVAVVNATEPLAILADTLGSDGVATHAAVPAEMRAGPSGPPLFTAGSPEALAPLFLDAGSRAAVHVGNLSSSLPATVRVSVMDAYGSPVQPPDIAELCPSGAVTVDLRVADEGGAWYGSLRVENITPPDAEGTVANLASSVLVRRARVPGAGSAALFGYELPPEQQTYRWPDGGGRCGIESGAALVAVPGVGRAGVSRAGSRLIVANAVPWPGATQASLLFYDQNGFVGGSCQRLAAQEVVALKLDSIGFLAPGFRGNAFISANWWNHAVVAKREVRNVVGLSVLHIQQQGDPAANSYIDQVTAGMGVPLRPNRDLHLARHAPSPARDLGCPRLAPPRDQTTSCGRPTRRLYLPWAVRPAER